METRKMIIYQVLPRLFGNDKGTNNTNGSIEENGSGKLSAFSKKTLTEIKRMGYSHIWYTGLIEHATQTDYSSFNIAKDHPAIVKGKAGSPYAIKDYYDIDPDLADDIDERMVEFEALVKRTHEAGLKVILDFVPNHVARQYHSDVKPNHIFDLGANDNIQTTYDVNNNFYYIPGQSFDPQFDLEADSSKYEEFPAKATGNNHFDARPSCNDWYETIKLNYGIDFLGGGACYFDPAPDTWHKMLKILLFWSSKKVDAFRCDMAEMVPVEFWSWAIPQVKEEYPSVVFIAEIYHPDAYRNYLSIGKFDYLYDKVGMYDTLRAVICGEENASAITSCWQSVDDIRDRMLYFLENHDEQRIASAFFSKDPRRAFPAMIVAATLYTNPLMVYFGQELGESGMEAEGFSGIDGRTTIFDYWSIKSIRDWRNKGKFGFQNLSDQQKEVRNFYIKLLTLCNKEKAIYKGVSYDLMYANYENPRFNSHKQYAYLRQLGNELLLIVANFDEQEADIAIFLPAHAFEFMHIPPDVKTVGKDLFSGKEIHSSLCADSFFELSVMPWNGKILKFTINE